MPYYGWNVVGAAMGFQAATIGLTFYAFTFWVEPWTATFDASKGALMVAFMLSQFAAGIVSPFAGQAMDRVSIRALVTVGVLAFAGGYAAVGFATAVWQIVVLYALVIPLGIVLAGPLAAQTLVAKWFRARRGIAMGWVTTGTSIGGLALPPLAAWLLLEFGWRQAHVMLGAGVAIVLLPLVWAVVRTSPETSGIEPEAEHRAGPGRFPEWSTGTILRERNFWALVLGLLPATTAFNGVQINLAPYAQDLGIGAQRSSFLMSLLAGTMIGGKLVFGALADRFDHRWVYGLAVLCLGAALASMTGRPGYPQLVGISVLVGFAGGGFLPLIGAIISTRFGPLAFGRVMGLTAPAAMLAAVGAPVAGWLRDWTGSYDLALQLFLGGLLLAGVAISRLGPTQRVVEEAPR